MEAHPTARVHRIPRPTDTRTDTDRTSRSACNEFASLGPSAGEKYRDELAGWLAVGLTLCKWCGLCTCGADS
jgi:hypothetical protein